MPCPVHAYIKSHGGYTGDVPIRTRSNCTMGYMHMAGNFRVCDPPGRVYALATRPASVIAQ